MSERPYPVKQKRQAEERRSALLPESGGPQGQGGRQPGQQLSGNARCAPWNPCWLQPRLRPPHMPGQPPTAASPRRRILKHFIIFFRRPHERLRQAPGTIVCLARQTALPVRGFFRGGFLAHVTSSGFLARTNKGLCDALLYNYSEKYPFALSLSNAPTVAHPRHSISQTGLTGCQVIPHPPSSCCPATISSMFA
jgi:hypothetical protein